MPESSAAGDEEFTFALPGPRDPPVQVGYSVWCSASRGELGVQKTADHRVSSQNPLLTKATVTTSSPTAGRQRTEALESVISRRKKVPFEIGHNPLDWLRLCKSKKDLSGKRGSFLCWISPLASNDSLVHSASSAGLNGSGLRRDITLAEVALHHTPEDAWTVIRRKVRES